MPMSLCFQVLAFWTVLHQMNLQCVEDMWDFQANMPLLLTTLKRAQQSSSTGATADAIIVIVAAEIFLAKVGVDVISKVCHVGHAILLHTGHFSKPGNRRVIINWYETYIFLFLLCFEAAPRPFVGLVLTNMEKPGKSTLAVAHHCKYDCNVPNSNYSFCKSGTNSQLPEGHIWIQSSQNQSCTESCISLHNKKGHYVQQTVLWHLDVNNCTALIKGFPSVQHGSSIPRTVFSPGPWISTEFGRKQESPLIEIQ